MLYGLSSRGQLPAILSKVHHKTRTPLAATLVTTLCVLLLALIGSLLTLAQATSLVMLTLFAIVNLSLWRVKKQDPRPVGTVLFPVWVPVVGFLASSAFVIVELINKLS